MYVVREKSRPTGGGVGSTIFFQEEIVFMLSAMMPCISFMQWEKNKCKWNWRTEMDETK